MSQQVWFSDGDSKYELSKCKSEALLSQFHLLREKGNERDNGRTTESKIRAVKERMCEIQNC